MDSQEIDGADVGSDRSTPTITDAGQYRNVFLLGFVLALLKVAVLLDREYDIGAYSTDLLMVPFLLILGAIIGLYSRGGRRTALVLGGGVGAGEIVLSLVQEGVAVDYIAGPDSLGLVVVRGLLVGVAVAGIALLAHRCGRLWGVPEGIGPEQSYDESPTDPSAKDAAGENQRERPPDGASTERQPDIRTATFLVALFGTLSVVGIGLNALANVRWPADELRFLVPFPLTFKPGSVLLAGLAGVVVGLAKERATRRQYAAVAVGAAAGSVLVIGVTATFSRFIDGELAVGSTFLGGIAVTAVAVWWLRGTSQRAVLGATALGTVLVPVLLWRSWPGAPGLVTYLWPYTLVPLVATTAYWTVDVLADPVDTRRGQRASGSVSRPSTNRKIVAAVVLGAVLPVTSLLVQVGVEAIQPAFAGGAGYVVPTLLELTRPLMNHAAPLLFAVVLGAVIGVTSQDSGLEVGAGAVFGVLAGTVLLSVAWFYLLPVDIYTDIDSVRFVDHLVDVSVFVIVAGLLAVAIGRWYAR